MLSKAGEILIGTGNTVPDYSADTDPAQGERNLEQPPPYSFEPSAAGPSTAGPSTAGPSNAAAGDDTWGSSLVQTFKALTSGFRAKPDPLATALCGASRNGDVAQIAAFLKQGANIDGKNENGETALECAILGNQETAARLLLSSGADEDQWSKMPPLFLAASVGNIEVARMIYERGGSAANVKKKSVSGQPYFVDLVSSGNLDGVRFLLERGADPKAQSVSGRYVVIQAARKVNVDMVRLLLDFGAKVNSDDISGNSMLAISLDKGSLEMLDLLIARGVKLSSRTTSGEKVLAAAIVKRNMPFARRLLEAGADGHVEDIHGQKVIIRVIKDTNKWSADEQAELVHMLLKNGAKPTSKDGHGSNMTALPLAIDKGVDGRIIASMIQHGGDGNKVLRSGETPLTHAINNGRMEQIHALLAGGVDPNLANKQNKTPLMQALVKDDIDLVKLLVKHGADVDAPKHSAREFAATLGRTDILEVLGVVPSGGVVSGVSDGPPGYDAVLSGKA